MAKRVRRKKRKERMYPDLKSMAEMLQGYGYFEQDELRAQKKRQ